MSKHNQPEKLQSAKHTIYNSLKPLASEDIVKDNLFEFTMYLDATRKNGIKLFLC